MSYCTTWSSPPMKVNQSILPMRETIFIGISPSRMQWTPSNQAISPILQGLKGPWWRIFTVPSSMAEFTSTPLTVRIRRESSVACMKEFSWPWSSSGRVELLLWICSWVRLGEWCSNWPWMQFCRCGCSWFGLRSTRKNMHLLNYYFFYDMISWI